MKVDERSSRLDGRGPTSSDGLVVVSEGSGEKSSLPSEC